MKIQKFLQSALFSVMLWSGSVLTTGQVFAQTSVGSITGRVEIAREFPQRATENNGRPGDQRTIVKAEINPGDIFRYFVVPGTNLTVPSSGPFAITNLPGGTGYVVYAQMLFRTNHNFTYLATPAFGVGSNPPVMVPAGASVNLGNALALDPGYINGRILLKGPPETGSNSMLRSLRRASDVGADQNGVPTPGNGQNQNFASVLTVAGVNRRAPGAAFTAANGQCNVSFPGDYNPQSGDFEGTYEAVVGGLNQEPSIWKPQKLLLTVANTSSHDPTTYGNQPNLLVTDNLAPEITVVSGQHYVSDWECCFGEVEVRVRSSSGLLYNPTIAGIAGGFQGTSFTGHPADYTVGLAASRAAGTPVLASEAAPEGIVRLLLPAGVYTQLVPHYSLLNGSADVTGEPITNLVVGCGERITLDVFDQNKNSINRFTVSGGGVNSSGGQYKVRGTIGQPVAGVMSGGAHNVLGGFWGAVASQPPLLKIAASGANIVICWPSPSTGYVLEQKATVGAGTWATVSQTPSDNGTIKCVTVPAGPVTRFFRLRKTNN